MNVLAAVTSQQGARAFHRGGHRSRESANETLTELWDIGSWTMVHEETASGASGQTLNPRASRIGSDSHLDMELSE
jgi:hypothetical protein